VITRFRELIANALDEQALSGTIDVEITRVDASDVANSGFRPRPQAITFLRRRVTKSGKREPEVIGKFGVAEGRARGA
jgi:hypothetical protein